MYLAQRVKNGLRGIAQRWGTPHVKRALWNREFKGGRWNSIEHTPGDVVYGYIEKYCRHGSILDLGCGSGNTGCELNSEKYEDYTGVDISDVAVEKAIERSRMLQRGGRNRSR